MVEFRKLISFGKSSYVISLPKAWIDKSKLLKGSLISVKEDSDNLILSPKLEEEKPDEKEIVINVDGKEYNQIRREIIPAYINNYHVINLVGKELVEKGTIIRDILHNLMALEIMEQTSEKLVAKDFVNMEKLNVFKLIHKIDVIARSMLDDLKFSSDVPCENLAARDEDINRITYLLYRAIKYAFNSPSMMREYKTVPLQLLNYWSVISAIERFSDQIKCASVYCCSVNLNKQSKEDMNKLLGDVKKAYLQIMAAFYNNDKNAAYKVALMKNQLAKRCDDLYAKHWKKEQVPLAIEKIRNMMLEVHNITRTVYNT